MASLFLFGTLVFSAALLLASGVYLAWRGMRNRAPGRVAQRVRNASRGSADSHPALSISKQRLLARHPLLQRALQALPPAAVLDRLLLQAGRQQTVAQLLGWCLASLLGGLLLGALLGLPLSLLAGLGALGAALPLLHLRRAQQQRLRRIEQQLPDALDLMGRAMRAGHAFPTALKMVGDEMAAPLGSEFRAVFDEVNFGVAMSDALGNLASRVPSTDLRYFVVAVLIQRETGGNLSELLGSISAIIRDRLKLLGQIRVLSAEGRMSAWILGLMPFAVALMMQLTNPDFLSVLYLDSGGRKMLATAGVMMALGILIIRKVTRIRI
ncbi:pilus assembly protein TadB [Janthinobacterium sp. BJB1]|uniref:type II secretion system F family protein n=1 Tax=Janthinobacterium sp. GW458P TaxID=1981504 RepID=UPI000A3236CB|nr:type II secretion system F family protein [Janthinobacterium sp. GW458P]MBE3027660.1 type II secretion system F family protein [Janthinobacterium sp. GW458P]PHV15004.1 pilus assembly protein TadB [Janthinobacterium sp. BJB303]PJC96937.1 pilus assembly protein TadB [Janthinobacterium sp. BJB1]